MVYEAGIDHTEQPPYETLEELLTQINGPNGDACRAIYSDYRHLFDTAPGSSHNHQAWPGGYTDHVTDAMNTVAALYDTLAATGRPLPFTKSDALFVIFLHDLEKPFKFTIDAEGNLTDNPDIPDKAARAAKRLEVMAQYGIHMDEQQANAMKYVEGIRDPDYTPSARIMGELAALCHCADTLSARMWYNYPLPEGEDQWEGAQRVNPSAAGFILQSELGISLQARLERGPDSEMDGLIVGGTRAQARERLLNVPHLELSQVKEMLGIDDIQSLVEDGTLLALHDHGDYLFPTFQFDPETNQPYETVSKINVMMDALHDGWGVTAWWTQGHGRLPDAIAPKELLGTPSEYIAIQLVEAMVDDSY